MRSDCTAAGRREAELKLSLGQVKVLLDKVSMIPGYTMTRFITYLYSDDY